jgi:hypothetical protein
MIHNISSYEKHYTFSIVNYKKSSWFQDHIHFLLTKRLKWLAKDISKIMIKISSISKKMRKKGVFFWRRNLTDNVYRFYKYLKFFFKSIIE